MHAWACLEVLCIAEVDEGIEVFYAAEDNVATFTTVMTKTAIELVCSSQTISTLRIVMMG